MTSISMPAATVLLALYLLSAIALLIGLRRGKKLAAWGVFTLVGGPVFTAMIGVLITRWPETASSEGVLLYAAQWVGGYLAVAIFSLAGMLTRKAWVSPALFSTLSMAGYIAPSLISTPATDLAGGDYGASIITAVMFAVVWNIALLVDPQPSARIPTRAPLVSISTDQAETGAAQPQVVADHGSVPSFSVRLSLLAFTSLGAASGCMIVLAAAGLAGGRLLEAMLLHPLRWLPVPTVIGAVAGAAIGALRRRP